MAYLKIGNSALQPLLYKGECKEASSSLYPYLSSGSVRRENSECRRGDTASTVHGCLWPFSQLLMERGLVYRRL
jgi:hypothetical protein